ncbi:unnamed protein product, partial [Polarella glacialis]
VVGTPPVPLHPCRTPLQQSRTLPVAASTNVVSSSAGPTSLSSHKGLPVVSCTICTEPCLSASASSSVPVPVKVSPVPSTASGTAKSDSSWAFLTDSQQL